MPGNAYHTVIVDTIPKNITYEPNSPLVNYSPGFENDMHRPMQQEMILTNSLRLD